MKRSHHVEGGKFGNPWPDSQSRTFSDLLRWRRERKAAPSPMAPLNAPAIVPSAFETPRSSDGSLSATWIGHATCLLQLGPLNVLTDPMWSFRASPVRWAGPKRRVRAAVELDDLPAIDLVLISHNHYDHLDRSTVARLSRRYPAATWFVPLGVGRQVRRWGPSDVQEMDWWESREVGAAAVMCTPARHFSGRTLWDRMVTLWAGWTIAAHGWRVFFAGDTAYHPEFSNIASRAGPFDLAILPIGAYEPRWFMEGVHMNPEDAVHAYRDLTAPHVHAEAPAMVPIHWGTFRLTDEPMNEPPARLQVAWREEALPEDRLWLLGHGQTQRRGVAG